MKTLRVSTEATVDSLLKEIYALMTEHEAIKAEVVAIRLALEAHAATANNTAAIPPGDPDA